MVRPEHQTDGVSGADREFLDRAVALGRRGWGRVHPNPMVGCVLVRDGRVVGEGWHEEFGGPHAEAHALTRAGAKAGGATAYVSLEPCNHVGRTPPCSHALLEAGVARVVYGGTDPGAESSGGARYLRAAGVEVVGPVFSPEEARRLNPAFYFNVQRQAPYVALKLAQTLDGKISEGPGLRTAITGPEARIMTHRLRAGFQGVMVGINTVLADDPELTVREEVPRRAQPTRVILDPGARTPLESKLVRGVSKAPVLLFTSREVPEDRAIGLEKAGADLVPVPRAEGGLDLEAVLGECWARGLTSLFCEGGGRLASALIRLGLVRRLYLLVAPFVLGRRGVEAFPGLTTREAWEAWVPAEEPRLLGRDTLLTFDWQE